MELTSSICEKIMGEKGREAFDEVNFRHLSFYVKIGAEKENH